MNRRFKFAVCAFFLLSLGLSAQQTLPADPAAAPSTAVGQSSDAGAAAAPSPSVAMTPDYVLGAQDVIQVTVWHEPTLSGNLVVRPDGMVSVPLLGDVRAAGLTPMALGRQLSGRLTQYVKEPLVTVTVVAVNSRKVYLIGEIAHPGPLELSPGMTVLQAISSAGGLTPYASARHVYILRGEVGKQKKIAFNYKKALKQGDQQGVTLVAGDTIVIP